MYALLSSRGASGWPRWRVLLLPLTLLVLAACGESSSNGSTSTTEAGASSTSQAGADDTTAQGGQATGDGSPNEGGAQVGNSGQPGAAGESGEPELALHADTVAPTSAVAGDTIEVTCLLLDEAGDSHPPDAGVKPKVTFAPADAVQVDADGVVTAVAAGDVEVACSFPALELTDETPATVEIEPGPVATLKTSVEPEQVVAGLIVTATCEAADAYGNIVIDANPSLDITPTDGKNSIDGLTAKLIKAGDYTLSCSLPGAASTGAQVEVVPALPAVIAISRAPDAPSYALGSIIEALVTVTDEFANVIDGVPLSYASVPAASGNVGGDQFFQYQTGGDGFVISATVTGPTKDDQTLSASTTAFDVEGAGPTTSCDAPLDAAMLNLAAGTSVELKGSWQGVNGVTAVTVDGEAMPLDDGHFTKAVTARFGMNFHDVVVTDKFGRRAKNTCTFLAANQWANSTTLYGDIVSLKLTQAAVDDSNRNNGLSSFADMLYAVANGGGVATTLDTALKSANPLKPASCDQQVCIPVVGCSCLTSSGVQYQSLVLDGPHTTDLTLVNGGYTSDTHFVGVHVKLRVTGSAAGVPFDVSGFVNYASDDVNMTLDQSLTAGKPHISLRPNSVTSTLGTITLDFPGIDGVVFLNVLTPLANGTLADMVKASLQSYVTQNFTKVLDGVVSGLDVSTLGTTFNVPRLDGSGDISLAFGLGFSSLSTSAARAVFGLSTKFGAQSANAYPSLGVAIPAGAVLNDPALSNPVSTAVSEHVGLFNQVAQALWRANLYAVTLDGSMLGGGAPAAAQVKLTGQLPPVANMAPYESDSPTGVELSLGALSVEVVYPDLFSADAPFQGELGARVTATAQLVGNDLKFGGLSVTELHLGSDIALSDAARTTLEDFLELVVERLADATLNQSLPALPIPAFKLPATLASYGLPASGNLGTVNPTLLLQPRHFLLPGAFGVR